MFDPPLLEAFIMKTKDYISQRDLESCEPTSLVPKPRSGEKSSCLFPSLSALWQCIQRIDLSYSRWIRVAPRTHKYILWWHKCVCKLLSDGKSRNGGPLWSTDGERIAFQSTKEMEDQMISG